MDLTADERAFLDASLERRRVEQTDNEARATRERRLERRARTRLLAFVGAAALFVAAVAYALVAWPGRAPDVVLVYPGPGDNMYDSTATVSRTPSNDSTWTLRRSSSGPRPSVNGSSASRNRASA
jgi:hypothetical protein